MEGSAQEKSTHGLTPPQDAPLPPEVHNSGQLCGTPFPYASLLQLQLQHKASLHLRKGPELVLNLFV